MNLSLLGVPYEFAGQIVIDAPPDLTDGCTRKRMLVRVEGGPATTTTAVRLHDGRVVLVVPGAVPVGTRAVAVEVEAAADARTSAPPPDLLAALAEAKLELASLDLPTHELRHLVSMVREARDPGVRAERIQVVVDRLRSWRGAEEHE